MGIYYNRYPFLFNVSIGGNIDADAQAFITAASITDITQKTAINQLVLDLKSYGLWTKIKAMYPFIGGTASTHKWNLIDPRDLDEAFRLVFSGGWTHSSNGALPNGVNAYANTFLIPSSNFSPYNMSLSYYSRTQDTSIDGQDMGSSGFSFTEQYTITQYYNALSLKLYVAARYAGSNDFIGVNDTNTQGLLIGTRNSQTSAKMFFNGTQSGSTLTQSALYPISNFEIYLGCQNANGSAAEFSTRECAFSAIGYDLTDTEAANLYTAVQAFQTTLGRQV